MNYIGDDLLSILFENAQAVAQKTASYASDFSQQKSEIRSRLLEAQEIDFIPDAYFSEMTDPSVSATDGSVIFDPKAMGDVCTAVAIRLNPDGSRSNLVFMDCVPREPGNQEVLKGIMSALELRLAAQSLADVVMIDGSLISGLINISSALSISRERKNELHIYMQDLIDDQFRQEILTVLTSNRHVAIPKYTTTSEFGKHLPDNLSSFDGKTIATMALKPGEMMRLFNTDAKTTSDIEKAKRKFGNVFGFNDNDYTAFVKATQSIVYSYYRPHSWTPAFKFDVPYNLFNEEESGLKVLNAIRTQTLSRGILEPLPLFLVDRFAKEISVGVSPIDQLAALQFSGDDEAFLLMLMGYRT